MAERYPDHGTAIVRVEATHTGTGLSRDEVNRALRRLFPRLHELKWADTSPEGDASAQPAFTPREGFAATVRGYLAERLKDDADKDAVLELAESFLAEGEAP